MALISARQGEGVEQVLDFLAGAMPKPAPLELPVLHDVPKCREWAGRVGSQAGYRAPIPPVWTRRLDAVFLHPVAGPLIFLAVVCAVFQTIFTAAVPLMDGVKWLFDVTGNWIATTLPPSILRSLAGGGRVAGRRLGGGLPAAGAAAVSVHRAYWKIPATWRARP